jgi:hypothetical protein
MLEDGSTQEFELEPLARLFAESLVAEEAKEGIAAFMLKRKAKWNN